MASKTWYTSLRNDFFLKKIFSSLSTDSPPQFSYRNKELSLDIMHSRSLMAKLPPILIIFDGILNFPLAFVFVDCYPPVVSFAFAFHSPSLPIMLCLLLWFSLPNPSVPFFSLRSRPFLAHINMCHEH